MVSYKKACDNLTSYLQHSPQVVIIDPSRFRVLMLLLKSPTQLEISFTPFSIVDIVSLIPDIFNKINPYGAPLTFNEPGATSLVAEYAKAWIPTGSPDYVLVLERSFLDYPEMETWQRGIRATYSQDKKELVQLSLDPDEIVRSIAQKRLKEFEL